MGMESPSRTPEEVFPLDLTLPKEELYEELDVRLNHLFEKYEAEGKLKSATNSTMLGQVYVSLFMEATTKYPQIKAELFKEYLEEHRNLTIWNPVKRGWKTTTKIVESRHRVHPPLPTKSPMLTQKDLSAGEKEED